MFVIQVYSPGASEEMMSHPGDAIPQSHYSPKGGLYADAYYMGKSCYEYISPLHAYRVDATLTGHIEFLDPQMRGFNLSN